MTKLRTALIQLRSGTDPVQNFADAQQWIVSAHAQGAKLIATPECTNVLQLDRQKWQAQITAQQDDPVLAKFCTLARDLQIHLCLGSFVVLLPSGKAANRSFVIDPTGKIIATYDKIHLFDVAVGPDETWCESQQYEAGTKAVLADIGPVRLGLSICYDLRFATLYQQLAMAGAGILMVPAAFTRVTGRAHWEILLRARAIETGSFVLAAAQGGAHLDGRRTWGRSMIVDPWGTVLAKLDHEEPGVLLADLDLAHIQKTRKRIPVLSQSKPFGAP